MYMNMTAEEAKYMLEANANLGEKVVTAFKKYWKENGEMICAGLASMSGQTYIPYRAK